MFCIFQKRRITDNKCLFDYRYWKKDKTPLRGMNNFVNFFKKKLAECFLKFLTKRGLSKLTIVFLLYLKCVFTYEILQKSCQKPLFMSLFLQIDLQVPI